MSGDGTNTIGNPTQEYPTGVSGNEQNPTQQYPTGVSGAMEDGTSVSGDYDFLLGDHDDDEHF